jgi:dolichol-phosphate mannosyltransferase
VAGFERATELGADLIVTMDADFSHHPKHIPSMIGLADAFDLVVGSRYVKGSEFLDRALQLRALSFFGNLVARSMLGLKINDCTSGFRCFRSEVIKNIDFSKIKADGYSFIIELLYAAVTMGYQTRETPISYLDRQKGSSKLSRVEIFKACRTLLRLSFQAKKQWQKPSLEAGV